MPVQSINHINIAVPQPLMQQVRDFYVEALGLQDRPRERGGLSGHWLYGGGAPLIHLMLPRDGATAVQGSAAIDHFALTCTDLEAMKAGLDRADVPYREREALQEGFVQLFVTDPAGIRVELNFPV